MTFTIRSLDSCVEAFRALRPGADLRKQEPEHYDCKEAWSYHDLQSWDDPPPLDSIYLFEGGPEYIRGDLADRLEMWTFGAAVGTWNARGWGRWAHEPGWLIADLEFVQEDDGEEPPLAILFAEWVVERGILVAVWRAPERTSLAKVMGLSEWPTHGWQTCSDVWYGE